MVTNVGGNNVLIFLFDGTGRFQTVNYPVGILPSSVAIGDFNGDGNPDVAVGNLSGGTSISILLGDGNGAFDFPINFVARGDPRHVAVGDFNGDRKPDLAVANFGSNDVSILLNTTPFLDQVPPDTGITSGPVGTIAVSSIIFTWSGFDGVSLENLTYAYRLDPIEASFSAYSSGRSKSYVNLPNGDYTFYVKAKDQAGNEDPTPATRSFTVNANTPDFTVTPTSISFVSVKVGKKSADQVVTVKNAALADLLISTITLGGAGANQFNIQQDHCSKKPLAPGASCSVALRFEPISIGQKTTNLVIRSNQSTVHVPLSGTGIP